MPSYSQRYVDALIAHAVPPANGVEIVGEIDASKARQPHIAVFFQIAPDRFLGTTAGVSARPMPLPVRSGLQYFELCAQTTVHSPRILWLLSNVSMFILSSLAPLLYGSDEDRAHVVEQTAREGKTPEPRPFLPFQTIRLGDGGERFLLVPRWSFFVPEGPPVEVIEPLPLTEDDVATIGEKTLDERAAWTKTLGDASVTRWTPLVDGR